MGVSRPAGEVGRLVQLKAVGADPEYTSCSNTRFVNISWSAASSSQRRSATTSSRTMATPANSGSVLFNCKPCHDSAKRFVETRGYRPDGGLDGWPLDPNHPANRAR